MEVNSEKKDIYSIQVYETEGNKKEQGSDYETAISATGFGTFNIFLVLATLPVAWSSAFNMTTPAFILASAECELELTFIRKGILCSVVYIGMIFSSFFWGFVIDRVPRRPFFLLGLLTDALCNILCSLVESYYAFLLLKFITGTIVSGPLSLLVPYLNEFQAEKYRSKFTLWSGLLFNIGFILPAVLAFLVTPLPWSFILFGKSYNSWRIFLLLCCLPSIIGFITMSFLPESPKRLIEDGYLPRAYDLLRQIYTMNTRLPIDTYPIKVLKLPSKSEIDDNLMKSTITKIKNYLNNLKLLFSQKYFKPFLMFSLLQFGSLLSFNTMRLWVPHMFIIINNFDYSLWHLERHPTICEYLIPGVIPPSLVNETFPTQHTCIQWHVRSSVYINSSIIAASAVGFSFLIGLFYTTKLRKKCVIMIGYLIGALCSFGTNWGQLVPLMLTLSAAIVVTGRTTGNIVIAANTITIPTPLRQTSLNFLNHIGNFGSIVGNIIFSTLLEFHCCIPAFFAIGAVLIVCLIVSVFILESKKCKEPKSVELS